MLGMVGPKAAASTVSVIGLPASTLLVGVRGHGRITATATAAETEVRVIKIHTERPRFEFVSAVCVLARFFRVMRALAWRTSTLAVMDTRILRTRPLVDNCQS